MEIRGRSSSPKPLLTPYFPEPQFPHVQSDLEIFFEVDSGYGFCESLCNLLFWWALQTPIGTGQEGEPCLRSAPELTITIFSGGFGNLGNHRPSMSPIQWGKGSYPQRLRRAVCCPV